MVIARQSERLMSLQDIQSELDATQAEAWQDLVRVLTHEIMNSITPVTSLAKTATDVVADLSGQGTGESPIDEDLEDLQDAIGTVARRSDSLMQFVDSYRQITRLAPPEKKRVHSPTCSRRVRLADAEWPSDDVGSLRSSVEPSGLDVYADRDLLEPVLLNLLRNAWQATESTDRRGLRDERALESRGKHRHRESSTTATASRTDRAQDLRAVLHDQGRRLGRRPGAGTAGHDRARRFYPGWRATMPAARRSA